MTGQKKQVGTIDRTFLRGLDLMLGSLIQKNDGQSENHPSDVTEEISSNVNGDVDVGSVLEDADNGAMDKQKDYKKSPKSTKSLSESDTPQTDTLTDATEEGGSTVSASMPWEYGVTHTIDGVEVDEQGKAVEKIGPAAAALAGAAAEPVVAATADRIRGKKTEKSHVKDATDLGDKTNLPPEMGRKDDKGSEGLVDDGSIAEPMLRRREIRKAVLGNIDRGIDLFQLWANVDRVIEKSADYSPHASDVDILKSFGLCECTKTEDIVEGTLVYKMITDRGSRPSSEWWNECVTFAKSVEGMTEPAFFAAFMYYEPNNFNPEYFMKGLNDTGGTPRTSRRGLSHDTEIDENIGAAGGQAIDGLGMSNDGDDGDDDGGIEKIGYQPPTGGTVRVKYCSHDGKNFEDECDCPNHENPVHKA